MSLFDQVVTAKETGPQINVWMGVNGVGKTSIGASFPRPMFFDLENGAGYLGVARIKKEQIADLKALKEGLKEAVNQPYDTINIDSAEALELLINQAVCDEEGVSSIEAYGGGYGKGFNRARELMADLFGPIRALKAAGKTVNIMAHTQIKSINDPATNQSYDRHIMRCNDKMAALIRDLSDNVFFCTYKTFTSKENGKKKVYSDGARIMYTSWRPGYDAKNRLHLPHELPLSYDAFVEACGQDDANKLVAVRENVEAMIEEIADESLKKQVVASLEKHKNSLQGLQQIETKLNKLLAA